MSADVTVLDRIPGRGRSGVLRRPAVWRRGIARGLDLVLAAVLAAIAVFVSGQGEGAAIGDVEVVLSPFAALAMTVASAVIDVGGVGRFSTTPGKRLMGLWVVDLHDEDRSVACDWLCALTRWACPGLARLVPAGDVVNAVAVCVNTMLVADRHFGRSLGDRLAGTRVVTAPPSDL